MRQDAALELALTLAGQGLHVFFTANKQPLFASSGFKDAINDPQLLHELARAHGGRFNGVAIYPGPSGHLVIDVDVKDGKKGLEQFRDLTSRFGGLVGAFVVKTPSGGYHVWLKKPYDKTVSNSPLCDAQGNVYDALDIRADGGYVMAFGADGYEVMVGEKYATSPIDTIECPGGLFEQFSGGEMSGGGTWKDYDPADPDIDEETHEFVAYLLELGFTSPTKRWAGKTATVRLDRPERGRKGGSVSIGYKGPGVMVVMTSSLELNGRTFKANSGWELEQFKFYLEHGEPSGLTLEEPVLRSEDKPTMRDEAYHGLIGDAVRLFEHTEADPAAILVSLLTGFGNLVGDKPYVELVAPIKQYARLNTLIVGASAKARKSAAWSLSKIVLNAINGLYVDKNIMGGFGSGHFLVDTLEKLMPSIEGEVGSEGGAVLRQDKRLMIFEDEFVRILKTINSDGSNYSAVLRSAFDGGKLEVRSRQKVSIVPQGEHHVSVLGCITAEELQSTLTNTEAYNGFGNRILFVWAAKTKSVALSDTELNASELVRIGTQLKAYVGTAQEVGRVQLDEGAKKLWVKVYNEMQDDDPKGLLGTIIARGDVHTIRLALIYALADGSEVITEKHIQAACAVWQYCRDTASHIFGPRSKVQATGDPKTDRLADKLYELLYQTEEGVTKAKLKQQACSRSNEHLFDKAMEMLIGQNKVILGRRKNKTGPPAEVYYAMKEVVK